MNGIKKQIAGLVLMAVAGAVSAAPVDEVNVFIGTDGTGHTTPAVWHPAGLVQPGPDSGYSSWKHCSGYCAEDKSLCGFSQTHVSGTGCPDMADFLLQPFAGENPRLVEPEPKFEHALVLRAPKLVGSEKGSPGYYSVTYADSRIRTEITASPRVAFYRFTAGEGGFKLLVDGQWNNARSKGWIHRTVLDSEMSVGGDSQSISGRVHKKCWLDRNVRFKAVFSRPFRSAERLPRSTTDRADRWVLDFGLGEGEVLLVKTSVSATSSEGVDRNLAEVPHWDFDAVLRNTADRWSELLSGVDLPGCDAERRTVFYTALYHAYLQPIRLSDAGEKDFYSNFSFWDTFRAIHPLYTVLRPETTAPFVESLLAHYRREGVLPVMPYFGSDSDCMIGKHAVSVIVDAFLKGVKGPDWNLAYEAVTNALTVTHPRPEKEDWAVYGRHGFYPFDVVGGEGVSRTMEIAFDDWCAARFAERMGDADGLRFFDRRAGNWTNVLDRSLGLVRGRDSKGAWRTPFSPFRFGGAKDWLPYDCTEGNAWQYTWHVFQDPQALIAALGGERAFDRKLKQVFTMKHVPDGEEPDDCTGRIGEYIHGNEPSHHLLYFFPLVNDADFAAEKIREVCDRFYFNAPAGLCGNDDCGQMSAWYLFSCLGFYPFNPCGGDFVLGAPQIPKAVLRLPGGRKLTVVAENLSGENKYVKRVSLNGKLLKAPKIGYADIMSGGELRFEMGRLRSDARPWEDPSVNGINRLPSRNDSFPLADASAALTDDLEPKTPYVLSLNGEWDFSWSGSPDRESAVWGKIDVPSCAEMRGYGTPIYTNIRYPHKNEPPLIGTEYNPMLRYRRTFVVPEGWKGRRVVLRFEGVYSCYWVKVNGKDVGYAEDSKLPSEFDITSCLASDGEANVLEVKALRWCDGSYLEDQDMFRFSGIFRDVLLWAKPKDGIWDFRVRTIPVDGYVGWKLEVKVLDESKAKVEVEDRISVSLYDAEHNKVGDLHSSTSTSDFDLTLAPRLWSAEDPYLYTLVIRRGDDIRATRVGFRSIAVEGNAVTVNGRAVKFKGVNRHDANPENGRTVSMADMLADVCLMKRANIDTVRTSHYPNDRRWYALCDRYGLYVIAEANVEAHGCGYGDGALGRKPEWTNAIVERNVNQVLNYCNHPSVVFWSLGNETGSGVCFETAARAVRQTDSTRLLHWERGNELADVDGRMYPPVEWLYMRAEIGEGRRETFLDQSGSPHWHHKGKPFIATEYAHAMGNAVGNFAEYWEAFYSSPSLIGGCIWDWIDQAVWKETDRLDVKDRRERYLAYGGDFEDDPNDGPFCCNGLVDPLRRPTAKLAEVAHVHRNLVVTRKDDGAFELWNRFGFTHADAFDAQWELKENGVAVARGRIDVPHLEPLSRGPVKIVGWEGAAKGERFLDVSFSLKTDALWAKKGHVVARDQIKVADAPAPSVERPQGCVARREDAESVALRAGATEAVFSRKSGTLSKLVMNGRLVLSDRGGCVSGPRLQVMRALTDNDCWLRDKLYASGLTQLRYHSAPLEVRMEADGSVCVVTVVEVAGARSAGFVHKSVYACRPDGSIAIRDDVEPFGCQPKALPRLGTAWVLDAALENVEWYGRGPLENYVDRQTAQFVGVYASTVSDLFVDYVRPQDCGMRGDVRWVRLTDAEGVGVEIASDEPFFFQALHYGWEDLEFARHRSGQRRFRAPPVPRSEVLLNVDWRQLGLGGASCGPQPLERYRFPVQASTRQLVLRPCQRLRGRSR